MNSAEYLLRLATHFSERDWNYTRNHDIKHIRYAGDYSGYYRIDRRVRRALSKVFRRRPEWQKRLNASRKFKWYFLISSVKAALRTEKHIPDGVLDGGNVITHWEETGEYLQMVQPSVGELVAQWLLAEPENEWAVKILAELDRISEGYSERIAAAKADGRPA